LRRQGLPEQNRLLHQRLGHQRVDGGHGLRL